ncbi:MAG TPA: hypothetical protein VLI39_20725 [Sedimentisphaerales bacterium]|nr:hypothetical protein [Sedimentisphaerales bacterium]
MAVQKKADSPDPTLKSTKQELLDAYAEMRQQLREKDKTQLKPEQKVQERKETEVLTAVQAMTAGGVLQKIGQLKQEMARILADLGDKLAAEVDKCNQVQQAIEIKEKELAEVFEIDKAAVKETAERIQREAKYQHDLLHKDFEGQKNVLTARIQSLEKAVKEQADQLGKLSQQQEASYQKIQDVAVKAIEGASKLGSFGSLVHTLKEQTRKPVSEE